MKTFYFPEVRVVEASAGSGKTYTLAKRYVQLLLNPSLTSDQIQIRHILAITFTNKAAFEMKERILDFLKKISFKQLSKEVQEDILLPIGLDPEKASLRSFKIMESIIHNYNFFQVQTIDKFINAILCGCAFKIGLTANFRIKNNSRDYLEHSLDELIDQAAKDKGTVRLFNAFLHQYLYLENRSGWFPKEDILAIMLTLFRQHNYYGYDFKRSMFEAEDLIKRKRSILEEMRKLKEMLPEDTDKRFANALEKFLATHEEGFDIDSVSEYFARPELPVRKDARVSSATERLWSKLRKDIKDLCEEEAFSLFDTYVDIFQGVKGKFKALSARDDVMFLDELNKKAGALFDEDYIAVEELYYRLATRFHHYLIDEFQDTSRLQWHNLEKMVEEALSTGGSLFYVGDKKQAIYSFRGGDVELFDEIRERFDHYSVVTEYLKDNRRSQKTIVEFNNHIFSAENLEKFIKEMQANDKEKVSLSSSDIDELKALFRESGQTFQPVNDQGYVKIEYVDLDKKEERNDFIREKVLDLLKSLTQRFAYRHIAFLTRSNAEVEEVTRWLLEEGFPVESERTSDIKLNPLIEELVCFLKFLNSPIDNLAFVDFILGDIFTTSTGLSKEALHEFVFSCRERLGKESDFYIYTEFRARYPDAWREFIEPFFKNIGLYPLYELIVSIYGRFDCLRLFPAYQGFFMHLLELIKKQEEETSDVGSFLEYFERLEGEGLYVPTLNHDSLRILTIHKAKGLEFPVVIIPFLGMEVKPGSQGQDQQQSFILQKDTDGLKLLRLKTKYLNFSEELKRLYAREYKKSLMIELNNCYVAMTRPKNELYAFIPKRVGQKLNLLKFLITESLYEAGQPGHELPAPQPPSEFLKVPCDQYHDWMDYLKDEFLFYEELKNKEERKKGKVIHYMLSRIGNLKDGKRTDILEKAEKDAELYFPQISSWQDYKDKLARIIEAKSLKDIFEVDGEVLNEGEFVNPAGHTKRIDRLLFMKDEIWVVDYKTSRENFKIDQAQVKEYIEIIEGIYPDKKVKGYLVFLDQLKKEEIYSTADVNS